VSTKPFIDLQGASGAQYRFRLWPQGAGHAPIGGNYAVVRQEAGTAVLLGLGTSLDLSLCRAEATRGKGSGVQVYTRLNVVRSVREAEHQDLVGLLARPRRRATNV
jgi:hypothetical protein